MRQQPGKLTLLFAFILTGMLLSACAGNAPKPDDAEIFQVKYAQDRWDALLAGDYEAAFTCNGTDFEPVGGKPAPIAVNETMVVDF